MVRYKGARRLENMRRTLCGNDILSPAITDTQKREHLAVLPNHGKAAYIIDAKHRISSRCEHLVYHHCERGYSLRLMIYTFGEEIHAIA